METTWGREFDLAKSDKNDIHAYGPIYDDLLGFPEVKPRAVLEIGWGTGASANVWAKWAPAEPMIPPQMGVAAIPWTTVIDILPPVTNPKFRLAYCDQCNAGHLAGFVESERSRGIAYDLIVDDGCHALFAQRMTAAALWAILKPGGLYVIEDIQRASDEVNFSGFPGYEFRDLREKKNRYDDLMVILRKPAKAG